MIEFGSTHWPAHLDNTLQVYAVREPVYAQNLVKFAPFTTNAYRVAGDDVPVFDTVLDRDCFDTRVIARMSVQPMLRDRKEVSKILCPWYFGSGFENLNA